MDIIRSATGWAIRIEDGPAMCLQRLSFRHGYRVGEICRELGCVERRLRRIFLRDTGLTPKDWMRRERMVAARRMLSGGRPPDMVAEHLGFTSKYNFRREFMSTYGLPPREYQRCQQQRMFPLCA